MSDTTVIAVVILAGVFLLMAITILKGGVEAAVRMWGVMGALTGVAFGSITSYYFTSAVKREQVASIEAEKASIEAKLASATDDASKARSLLQPVYSAILDEREGEGSNHAENPVLASLPASDRADFAARMSSSDVLLKGIEHRGAAVEMQDASSASDMPNK